MCWAGGAPLSEEWFPTTSQPLAGLVFLESSQKKANLWVSRNPDLSYDCFKSGLQLLISGILVILTELFWKTYLVSGSTEVTLSGPKPGSALGRASVCVPEIQPVISRSH